MKLQDRTVILTGASGGIGRAIANLLNADGSRATSCAWANFATGSTARLDSRVTWQSPRILRRQPVVPTWRSAAGSCPVASIC